MNIPLVGIMMPVFNGADTIIKSITSLILQSFKDWHCIIINDGSTDNTYEVLKTVTDRRFTIINFKTNEGRGAARKVALKKILEYNVKYICMLDADDIYLPDKLERQVFFMNENENYSLMSSAVGIIDIKEKLISVVDSSNQSRDFFYNNYKDYKPVSFASSIIRAADLQGITFDEKMTFAEDQDFLVRFLLSKKYTSVSTVSYLYCRDLSFSLSKYKQSIKSELYTLRKLRLSSYTILMKRFIADVKIIIVTLLYSINMERLYLAKMGRAPNINEIKQYQDYRKTQSVKI